MKDIDYTPLIKYFLVEHPFATVITVLFLIVFVVFIFGALDGLNRATRRKG